MAPSVMMPASSGSEGRKETLAKSQETISSAEKLFPKKLASVKFGDFARDVKGGEYSFSGRKSSKGAPESLPPIPTVKRVVNLLEHAGMAVRAPSGQTGKGRPCPFWLLRRRSQLLDLNVLNLIIDVEPESGMGLDVDMLGSRLSQDGPSPFSRQSPGGTPGPSTPGSERQRGDPGPPGSPSTRHHRASPDPSPMGAVRTSWRSASRLRQMQLEDIKFVSSLGVRLAMALPPELLDADDLRSELSWAAEQRQGHPSTTGQDPGRSGRFRGGEAVVLPLLVSSGADLGSTAPEPSVRMWVPPGNAEGVRGGRPRGRYGMAWYCPPDKWGALVAPALRKTKRGEPVGACNAPTDSSQATSIFETGGEKTEHMQAMSTLFSARKYKAYIARTGGRVPYYLKHVEPLGPNLNNPSFRKARAE